MGRSAKTSKSRKTATKADIATSDPILKKSTPRLKTKASVKNIAAGRAIKTTKTVKPAVYQSAADQSVDNTAAKQAAEAVRLLGRLYPDATCSLDFQTPLELLVATILSAQCTDERVNIVTKTLFRKYRSAADYARAPVAELEKEIQSTGFFRNKAKSIQNCCRLLVEKHQGQVPQSIDELVALAGVGRKTANVILGTAFGIASGVVVDTHVMRLSRRLGLSRQKDAEKIEKDLMEVIPKKEWIAFSHRMIQHGRKVCAARKPRCDDCPMSEICPRVGVEKA
jgi:endonuclease-3